MWYHLMDYPTGIAQMLRKCVTSQSLLGGHPEGGMVIRDSHHGLYIGPGKSSCKDTSKGMLLYDQIDSDFNLTSRFMTTPLLSEVIKKKQ